MAQLPQHRVGNARRSFFERGTLPVGTVPDAILQSWRRCQRSGLAVDAQPQLEPLPGANLRELRERHERLWHLARAELDGLAAHAASTDSIVLLTDESGWILNAEGNAGFLDRAGRVALMPGVCWSEAAVGTNAIGTAIVEGRAIEVRGGEHFFAPHGILSCAATPIHDPHGQLVGVLDFTGPASVQQMHALGLARLAANRIEHRFFENGMDSCELLRLHHDRALLGTAGEGVLGFRNGRLVAANGVGLRLFGLERGDIGRASYEALFDAPLSRMRDDGMLQDRSGRILHGQLEASAARVARAQVVSVPVPQARPALPLPAAGTVFSAAQELQLARAGRVLEAGLPVLLQGETGTGKEVAARALHARGSRAGKPFVAVNCAALPEGLIEAELFGYEEGAFTGARRQGSPGLLRQAQGGVLFLDEIGDMPLALQPRLLRVLQDRELSPLGGGKPVKLDFMLVCATHCDLQQAMDEGRFRSDLYYRIADHVMRLPALREEADRTALVQALWAPLAQQRTLSDQALQKLAAYPWPGNLRQLVACLRTLVALSEPTAVIAAEGLPEYLLVAYPPAVVPAGDGSLQEMTLEVMRQALAACNGNVSQAAKRLGVNRSTLYRRLKL
ncbi:sigma-54-dependent Fis family transcriptional regulator [Stenotrophomonas sp. STM01]|uniref:sigma-54-dependent Fis family transcriptional regulator n=1 Tax=Stenotrophomonas sp. STM01 TaxID=2769278 RepID=UPI00177CA629|nr:sigma-54-dependent Fis family transcriptional regulator [Stenotrophomonas sp. STM01]MBD9536135.1 sigma-54-dependent Fis family transcriptional regulator [Stenotrophomonas sp. STM01]